MTEETDQTTLARWLRAGMKVGEATENDDHILAASEDEHDPNDWAANAIGFSLIGKFGSAEAAYRAYLQAHGSNLCRACRLLEISEEFAGEVLTRQRQGVALERIITQLEREEL